MRGLLKLDVVIGMPQQFARVTPQGLCLLVAKYLEDSLIAVRNEEWLGYAREGIGQSFETGQWTQTPQSISINSTEVTQHPDCTVVSMHTFLRDFRVIKLPLRRARTLQARSRR